VSPAMPPRDWHMAVKEYVRQQMFSEMEPIRVQVEMMKKQILILDEKSVAVVPARSNSRGSDRQLETEKKMTEGGENDPRLEGFMKDQADKFNEVHNRVGRAEGVLRELGALHDKFAQRHDSLVECVRDLDVRIDNVDNAVARAKVPLTPPGGPLPSVPEDFVPDYKGHAPMPPGFVPPPANFGNQQHAGAKPSEQRADPGNNAVWTAREHAAALEVEEFAFEVERLAGVSLGIVLRNDGSKLVIDQIQDICKMPVQDGDRIVGIDGIRADSKKLLELIRRQGLLRITCQRLLTTSL